MPNGGGSPIASLQGQIIALQEQLEKKNKRIQTLEKRLDEIQTSVSYEEEYDYNIEPY